MRILVQKSKKAFVTVNNDIVGSIKNGIVIFVGFTYNDNVEDIDYLINKLVNLRIFNDENGVMNKSILEVGGEILSVSQFTLYADATKGRRPSYINALKGDEAIKLYDLFNDKLKEYVSVSTGIFGADMEVSLINDGPTTILLESKKHE